MTGDGAAIGDDAPPAGEIGYRQIGPFRIRRDASIGPIALIVVSVLGIGAVFWGQFMAEPGIVVIQFDAGAVDDYAIGKVVAFEERDLYLVGMEDGRIRAVDGRVNGSDCAVTYIPDDPRGRLRNPNGVFGVLEDPCSGDVWAMTGDAISGADQPLRTPQLTFARDDAGVMHVWVEIISADDDGDD